MRARTSSSNAGSSSSSACASKIAASAVARCRRNPASRRIDLVAREFHGLRQAGPLGVRRSRLVVGDRRPPAVQHVCRPDGNAGRSAHRPRCGSACRLVAVVVGSATSSNPRSASATTASRAARRVRTPRSQFQLVALARAERRDSRQTRCEYRRGPGAQAAQPDAGVKASNRGDQPSGRSRVQPVGVRDDQGGGRRRRPLVVDSLRSEARPLGTACAPASWLILPASAFAASAATSDAGRAARCGDERDDESFDQRCRTDHHAGAQSSSRNSSAISALSTALPRSQKHNDAVGGVDLFDRLLHGHCVGAEGAVVEPGSDRDGGRISRHHLASPVRPRRCASVRLCETTTIPTTRRLSPAQWRQR